MASSPCEKTEAGAPARGEKRTRKTNKMKAVKRRPHMKLLLTSPKKWEPLPSLDQEFLRNITVLIATDSSFSLDKYLRLDNMGDVLKAENDLLAELGEQYQDKGFC